MRAKRGYLAAVLLAGVMVAGYLGMLPLLQSLAAEPSWPEAPAAVEQAAPAITLDALDETQVASSKPAKQATRKPKATRQARPATRTSNGRSNSAANRPATGGGGGGGDGGGTSLSGAETGGVAGDDGGASDGG